VSQPYIGQILLVGFNFAPQGFLTCDGASLPISEYDALFTLLGTTYGGNGVSTFNIPDLRGRVTVHQGQGSGLGSYAMGQTGGAENVTVVSAQMPLHTHGVLANPAGATSNNANNLVFAGGGQNKPYSDQPPASPMNTGMVSAVGGNQPHTNQQPFLVCNWIIAWAGIFPTQ